jgi:hypothetical protein
MAGPMDVGCLFELAGRLEEQFAPQAAA